MASKLKRSPSDSAYYKSYKAEGRWLKNQITKLERLVKKQPNNKPLLAKLEKALDGKLVRRSGRKSNGHICKGLNTNLGFEKNQPNGLMLKSKLPLTYYYSNEFNFDKITVVPAHTISMGDQLETLGYERRKNVRAHKKTTR